jgi:hypothetical protein
MVDAAMRADADRLQALVIVDQIVEAAEGEGDVMQPGFPAGLGPVGFALGQRPGVEKGDAVVLVVIADERDALGLVENFGAEHRAIPIDHLAPAVGLQHDMRELFW